MAYGRGPIEIDELRQQSMSIDLIRSTPITETYLKNILVRTRSFPLTYKGEKDI